LKASTLPPAAFAYSSAISRKAEPRFSQVLSLIFIFLRMTNLCLQSCYHRIGVFIPAKPFFVVVDSSLQVLTLFS